jgi:hypothetical protein
VFRQVRVASSYGAAGAIPLISPWVYYSGFIFLLRCGIHQRVRSAMDVGKSVTVYEMGSTPVLPWLFSFTVSEPAALW